MLGPGLGWAAGFDSVHGDATFDRADQPAEIAAYAGGFVHARNTLGRSVGGVDGDGGRGMSDALPALT